ncbi:cilia- and flagella-associated protein HOATZ isoform X2 [Scleropages formosus]|uniref:Cilia- and flagella-associated protein HOATZ n=1 Tax=Scleropages formosus TaxID=113540 RepID=A0A8C9VAX7_SCLFO|nr:UPF0722 protein C11orf88 homolog isoform X2 [Scleropages formosus]
MSEQQGEHAFADLDKYYTVFAGSSPEDVAYAKVFWNSFNLHPPLESRLVSADMRQRLQVAGSTRDSRGCPTSDRRDEKLQEVYIKQRLEEKQRYLEMERFCATIPQAWSTRWPFLPSPVPLPGNSTHVSCQQWLLSQK